MYNFYRGKKQHIFWDTIVIFKETAKKLPKELNRPIGEKSPNLVALVVSRFRLKFTYHRLIELRMGGGLPDGLFSNQKSRFG
jgi:hypothetical protein